MKITDRGKLIREVGERNAEKNQREQELLMDLEQLVEELGGRVRVQDKQVIRAVIRQATTDGRRAGVKEFMQKIEEELKDPKEKEVELAAAEYLKRIRKLLPFALKYIENRSNKK